MRADKNFVVIIACHPRVDNRKVHMRRVFPSVSLEISHTQTIENSLESLFIIEGVVTQR